MPAFTSSAKKFGSSTERNHKNYVKLREQGQIARVAKKGNKTQKSLKMYHQQSGTTGKSFWDQNILDHAHDILN